MQLTPEQQAHVDQLISNAKLEWETSILDPIKTERDSLLKYKPVELTDEQKEIARLKAELNHQKIVSQLKVANLDDFIDLVNFEDDKELPKQIEKLNAVLQARKLDNSFVPDQHRQTSKYEQARKQGNTVEMIKVLFQ